MLNRRIVAYISFARQCMAFLASERTLFIIFIVLSVFGALTEGASVALLVPILETQGGSGGFSSIPLLGAVGGLFGDLTPTERIKAVAIAMLFLVILRNLLQYVIDVLGSVIPLRLDQKSSMQSYAALMDVEIGYIHQNDYGTHVNSLGGWSHSVSLVLTSFAAIMWNLLIIVVYVVLMLFMSWQLTMLALCFVLIMSLMLRWLTSSALHRASQRLLKANILVSQMIIESITGMKLVRLAAAEPVMIKTFGSALAEQKANQRWVARVQALTGPLLSACAGIFICVLLYGNAVIHAGESSTWVGTILLFLLLLFRLMGPVNNVNAARSRIVSNINAFDSLNAFFAETKARRQPNGSRPVTPLERAIEFENVSFAYAGGEKLALKGVSTRVERGQMVAIVGPSGAGKSTMIALATRLYDPQQGQILVDGIDLRELDVRAWRKRTAVVSQDTFIFNDTVANNIRFGQGETSMERIREAARYAVADEFIEKLPQGYDTMLGDRGVRLSGGEQQRISIARAVLVDPDLLILDEATSHLDTFTERAIQEAMERISKNRTVLVIAHRLSTIRKADKVIVMEDGRIVEEGRHRELLNRRDRYWEMVEHQRLDLMDDDSEKAASEVPA